MTSFDRLDEGESADEIVIFKRMLLSSVVK